MEMQIKLLVWKGFPKDSHCVEPVSFQLQFFLSIDENIIYI